MVKSLLISTQHRYQLIDITDKIEGLLKESKVDNGICLVFIPHSTAAIILTENESGLLDDWVRFLKKLVSGFEFVHNKIDDNADSHILSGFLGQEKNLVIENGELVRGRWQQIFLVELDGPRERKVVVKFV